MLRMYARYEAPVSTARILAVLQKMGQFESPERARLHDKIVFVTVAKEVPDALLPRHRIEYWCSCLQRAAEASQIAESQGGFAGWMGRKALDKNLRRAERVAADLDTYLDKVIERTGLSKGWSDFQLLDNEARSEILLQTSPHTAQSPSPPMPMPTPRDHLAVDRSGQPRTVHALLVVEPGVPVEEILEILPSDPLFFTSPILDSANGLLQALMDESSTRDIAIVACARSPEFALRVLGALSEHAPTVAVLLLARDMPNDFFRAAFEAGADDIIILPASAEQVRFELMPLLRRAQS